MTAVGGSEGQVTEWKEKQASTDSYPESKLHYPQGHNEYKAKSEMNKKNIGNYMEYLSMGRNKTEEQVLLCLN